VSSTRFFVGLDAGASKTLLLAQEPGSGASFEHRGPGANPNRIGREAATDVMVRLIETALREASGVEQVAVCAGVAGAGRPEERQALTEALRTALRGSTLSVRVEVVHDALIGVDAAYDNGSGVIVISGTGSVVVGRTTEEDLLRAGGWGHVLGDAGSGHALGRAGLRAVAEAFDGGTDTLLQTRVREQYTIDDRDALLQTVYRDAFDVQAVAPMVIEAAADGDAVASDLLDTQVGRLADQVGWLLSRSEALVPRITLLGGLLKNDHYEQCLCRRLRNRFPDWTVTVLQEEPVVGALRRARRLQTE
jgi:N-acetylglucosamine kinase-like BadF-type ATPase